MEKTKSGVILNAHFRDSLIIDKYDPVLKNWRGKKLEHLRSENSEDAITWNVFQSLKKLDPNLWVPLLYKSAFRRDYHYSIDFVDVHLWKKLNPPGSYPVAEGQTEVDILIENTDFVWIIEAKYKSDISVRTTNDDKRNQVVRNIDIGLEHANKKKVYFSLLILNDKYSPIGTQITNSYTQSNDQIRKDLPHQNKIDNLNGVSLLNWDCFLDIFQYTQGKADNAYERFVSEQAFLWLHSKISQ